jgi:integrase
MARRLRRRTRGHGSIVRPNTIGGVWGVRYGPRNQRRFRGGFESREDAENFLAELATTENLERTGRTLEPSKTKALADYAQKFMESRETTHRAANCDGYRWRKHLAPYFAHLKPHQVSTAAVHDFVVLKKKEGLAQGTIRILVSLLSALFADLVERRVVATNPVRILTRQTRRLIKPTHDPRTTPFIEKLEDVRRIFLDLPEPLNVAYAIGALAGLRTGEVFALKWEHVDLGARRIHVRESVAGPLKDKDSRVAPILDSLLPILAEWKLKSGGAGRIVPPMRCDGQHLKIAGGGATTGKYLRETLVRLGLWRKGLGWYECTRHTFASQWVLNGGSIEKLKEMLGHYSVVVTERYAHLRPDLFTAGDLGTLKVSLKPGTAPVVPLSGAVVHSGGSAPQPETQNVPNSLAEKREKAGAAL